MSKNNLLTNDALESQARDGYPDSVDFFAGSNIKIHKKEYTESDSDNNDEGTIVNDIHYQKDEDIAGLEKIILGFPSSHKSCLPIGLVGIDGQEGLVKKAKDVLEIIIQFIKDVGNWIYNVFTNKIYRIDVRTKYTEQKRKINGIKEGAEVTYPASIRRLLVPSIGTDTPSWVPVVAKQAMDFYANALLAQRQLKLYIKEKPTSAKQLISIQNKVAESIGRMITKNGINKGIYKSNTLPGNRDYNIKISSAAHSRELLLYFSESSASVTLKSPTFKVSIALIDDVINKINKFKEIMIKEQKHTSSLINDFKNEIENQKRNKTTIAKETRDYYIWLININKRLVNTTLQYATSCIEALDDFVNAGLK